jgi:hypothetical protein
MFVMTYKELSSRKFANMTFANRTFANGERHVNIRHYIPRTLANWQKSGGHSPIYLLNFRQ